MFGRLLVALSFCLLLALAPVEAAAAAARAAVPEGDSVTLFALGLAGLLLGRRLAARRSDKSDKSDKS